MPRGFNGPLPGRGEQAHEHPATARLAALRSPVEANLHGSSIFHHHIRDAHLHPPDNIAEDIYFKHLLQVELCQQEQMALLLAMVKEHGLRAVWVEGMSPENKAGWLAKLEPFHGRVVKLPAPPELLNAGAASRLWLAGELPELLPLEDGETYRVAGVDGEQDQEGNRMREAAMVRRIVARGEPMAVVVLGASHKLAGVVRQVAPGWEVVTVTINSVNKAAGE